MDKKLITPERRGLADRLRQIREGTGHTQESFAEILGITLSAYKKVESAENQMTLDGLRRLDKELQISADYLLYGKRQDLDETWKMIQNCSDYDKMFLMLRLLAYFTKMKGEKYLEHSSLAAYDETFLKFMKQLDP